MMLQLSHFFVFFLQFGCKMDGWNGSCIGLHKLKAHISYHPVSDLLCAERVKYGLKADKMETRQSRRYAENPCDLPNNKIDNKNVNVEFCVTNQTF